VDVTADLVHETEKAYLLRSDTGDEAWVPKAAVEYDRAEGVFTMPRRLAEEKGLV
jgi:hypothetical protein